jgi:dephospho-CoA kinase
MSAPALLVGLTGGIASGKSSVARLFEALGVPVVDADAVAREVVAAGTPGLDAIRVRFGERIIAADGELDRAALRARVFADPAARRDLEAILHPRIRRIMDERLRAACAPYAIAMIPLLLETGQQDRFDRVLVVDVTPATQLQRAHARDGTPHQTLQGILAAQLDRDNRLAQADDVIDNEGDPQALPAQVARLHESYLARAACLRAVPQQ